MKVLRNLALFAFAGATMTGCFVPRPKHFSGSEKTINSYITRMNSESHQKFLAEQKAASDLAQDARVDKLDEKDAEKNIYMDRYGANTLMRDARLVYDFDYSMIYQIYLRNTPVDKNTYGLSRAAPILFLDQTDDKKADNIFDKRFRQVGKQHEGEFRSKLETQLKQKNCFTLNKDGSVTQRRMLSKGLNVCYDIIYDVNNDMIYGQCLGTDEKFKQPICTYKEANPALKETYDRAKRFSERYRTLAVN